MSWPVKVFRGNKKKNCSKHSAGAVAEIFHFSLINRFLGISANRTWQAKFFEIDRVRIGDQDSGTGRFGFCGSDDAFVGFRESGQAGTR